MTIRIANAAGFLGDNLDAPRLTVEKARVDYLTLEYLAELTMSILARAREKDPAAGYAGDFITVLKSLTPALAAQPQLKIVTNAGGVNPTACAAKAAEVLRAGGLEHIKLGVVSGDDLSPRLDELQANGVALAHMDTGQPLSALPQPVVSANAYLGAHPVGDALAAGARIVITGRIADAALVVGPVVHEFQWGWDDWNRLAAASVAGHLIECGAQVTGGFYTNWNRAPQSQKSGSGASNQATDIDLGHVGYPIAELEDDGTCVITKPEGTGGIVNRQTVCEQLVYEIGDPAHYLTPDVDVDFTQVEAKEIGENRVQVSGARGGPAPPSYKVSLAYRDGFLASGQMLVYGQDCREKAAACARIIRQRLATAGWKFADEDYYVECLGAGDSVPGLAPAPTDLREVMLRVSVRHPRREAVEWFGREFAPLATSGPAGLAGYTAARGASRPVFAYWPTLIDKQHVQANVEVRTAKEFN